MPPEPPLALHDLAQVDATPTMRIGEVASRLGLSHRSIRYYEEEQLVIPAGRTPGGFRLYSALDVQRFLIIMSMRPLDFSLEEISRLLAAIDDGMSEEPERQRRALTILDEFAEATEERWVALRQQVEIARTFRSYLGRQVAEATVPRSAATPAD
jgi:MerR family copper efflux transcriptional regulator